ncbi:hypothetical protein ACFLWN_00555 [Chloroflexota bacterium]
MLRDSLLTKTQSPGQKSEASQKRAHNINWLFNLPKDALLYKSNVKQLLIHTTSAEERIFIQYPGKESAREGDKKRPHDFFPRVLTKTGYAPDLSFWDIWRLLFEQLEPRKEAMKEEMRVLAALFYRMAFMIDHNPIDFNCTVNRIAYAADEMETETSSDEERLGSLFVYQLPDSIIDYFDGKIDCGGISFEAFLHYNNLLAWNEDCKYFYRAQLKGKPWMNATGRINNLLTHISVLGYLVGELKTFDIFYKFSAGAGVAPATSTEIQRITNGLVHK